MMTLPATDQPRLRESRRYRPPRSAIIGAGDGDGQGCDRSIAILVGQCVVVALGQRVGWGELLHQWIGVVERVGVAAVGGQSAMVPKLPMAGSLRVLTFSAAVPSPRVSLLMTLPVTSTASSRIPAVSASRDRQVIGAGDGDGQGRDRGVAVLVGQRVVVSFGEGVGWRELLHQRVRVVECVGVAAVGGQGNGAEAADGRIVECADVLAAVPSPRVSLLSDVAGHIDRVFQDTGGIGRRDRQSHRCR